MHTMHAMEPVVLPTEKTRLLPKPGPTVQAAPSTAWTEILVEAAGDNDLKGVRACLEQGAEINGYVNGTTALTSASIASIARGNIQPLIALLLERKADATLANEHGMTPLHLVLFHPNTNVAVLELLKNAGADVNAQNLTGKTPCYCAVISKALKAIAWLHKNGADMNNIDKLGGAPVHWAVYTEEYETLHQLLMHGGQLDIRTQPPTIAPERIQLPLAAGSTPFHSAARSDCVFMKNVLLYHALFFDAWNKEPKSVNFLEMLVSRDVAIRKNARGLLQRRATRLREILCIQDSLNHTAGIIESRRHKGDPSKIFFNPDKIQDDMINYLLALEANCTDNLPPNNMFKAAHDAKEALAPTSCVIC